MKKYLNFAIDISKVAGKVMKKYFASDNGAGVSNGLIHNEIIELIKDKAKKL